MVCLHFKTKISESLCELLLASIGSLLAKGVSAISDPVLGLARFDGRMEYVRSVLDLEVKGVVLLGDLFNGAKDVFLTDVTEGTILQWVGEKRVAWERKKVGH